MHVVPRYFGLDMQCRGGGEIEHGMQCFVHCADGYTMVGGQFDSFDFVGCSAGAMAIPSQVSCEQNVCPCANGNWTHGAECRFNGTTCVRGCDRGWYGKNCDVGYSCYAPGMPWPEMIGVRWDDSCDPWYWNHNEACKMVCREGHVLTEGRNFSDRTHGPEFRCHLGDVVPDGLSGEERNRLTAPPASSSEDMWWWYDPYDSLLATGFRCERAMATSTPILCCNIKVKLPPWKGSMIHANIPLPPTSPHPPPPPTSLPPPPHLPPTPPSLHDSCMIHGTSP